MWNVSVVSWDAPVSGYPFSRIGPSLTRLWYHHYGESFTFTASHASSLLLHSTASCFYSVSFYHVRLLHFAFSVGTHFCLPYCPATKWGWKCKWNVNFCSSFSYISSEKKINEIWICTQRYLPTLTPTLSRLAVTTASSIGFWPAVVGDLWISDYSGSDCCD